MGYPSCGILLVRNYTKLQTRLINRARLCKALLAQLVLCTSENLVFDCLFCFANNLLYKVALWLAQNEMSAILGFEQTWPGHKRFCTINIILIIIIINKGMHIDLRLHVNKHYSTYTLVGVFLSSFSSLLSCFAFNFASAFWSFFWSTTWNIPWHSWANQCLRTGNVQRHHFVQQGMAGVSSAKTVFLLSQFCRWNRNNCAIFIQKNNNDGF